MTIKEFLADGGRINARWDFTDFASHEVDQSNSTENFSSVDDIVQDAIEQGYHLVKIKSLIVALKHLIFMIQMATSLQRILMKMKLIVLLLTCNSVMKRK